MIVVVAALAFIITLVKELLPPDGMDDSMAEEIMDQQKEKDKQ